MPLLARRGAAGRTYKVPQIITQYQESPQMDSTPIGVSPCMHRPQNGSQGFCTDLFPGDPDQFNLLSDHGGHDFANAPLELAIIGYRTADRDFAGKVRMDPAADQLRGVHK